MYQAGRIVVAVLSALRKAVQPGISTADLDHIAYDITAQMGGKPAFLGYHGFPASICASINDEVVHGIPSPSRVLREGDIVSLDFGAFLGGLCADAAITVPVGEVSPEAQRLLAITEDALWQGIQQARVGNRLGDIGAAIERCASEAGFSVVREFVGHGIGRAMHEDPQVPNYGQPGTGKPLRAGMVLAIEPMVNIGTEKTVMAPDGWTVLTADHSLSAHFEHTVAVTGEGPRVLTLPEQGRTP